jgi:pyroglutamyl-peptidase
MAQSPVLITGFGPFPGVPDNVSGRLAEMLAGAQSRHAHVHILPTEWETVAMRAPSLLDRLKPRAVLHFGVNMRARGFRIERAAHNVAAAREDASGALRSDAEIVAGGCPRIESTVPALRLARLLRAQGLPANASGSAGSYICNFLYYLSLDWASRQEAVCDVCFVHVPPATALTEAELLRGARLILGYLQDHIETGTMRSHAPARATDPRQPEASSAK